MASGSGVESGGFCSGRIQFNGRAVLNAWLRNAFEGRKARSRSTNVAVFNALGLLPQ